MIFPQDEAKRLLAAGTAAVFLHLLGFGLFEFFRPVKGEPPVRTIAVELEIRHTEPAPPGISETVEIPKIPEASPKPSRQQSETSHTSPPEPEPEPEPEPDKKPPSEPAPRSTTTPENPLPEPLPEPEPRERTKVPSLADQAAPETRQGASTAQPSSPPGETLPTGPLRQTPSAPTIDPTRYVEPQYPEAARRNAIEGTVVLEISINNRGRVGNIHIRETSGSDILDREALRAVRLWRFDRAHANTTTIHRVTFRLD
ncbi:energy transducer TonB [Alkalispirochaeta alkalica]|uniref:energy transducer TonB n=1 Tax=Alkalispirochaeta alkalica TaxID=46356 RepID=UPI000364A9C5|nr:energy transducer TonB [Alkalispirochaeta alkalica]